MGKNKHKFLKAIVTGATTMYAVNKWIDYSATQKHKCSTDHGFFYDWKHGQIFYTKNGSGRPLLLIHSMDVTSSTYEWSKVIHKLEKDYTVYSIDLLGCGQSDKPSLTYTNYLFVQLVSDFVKEIIGQKCDIITSNDSASFVVMANSIDENLFDKIIMINPPDLKEMKLETTKLQMYEKQILYLPLIGTSLYNYYMQESRIKKRFSQDFFSNQNTNTQSYIDTYYQSAHIHNSSGRYMYASKKCSYLNIDMTHALVDQDNLFVISSTGRFRSVPITDAYTNLNSNIEVTYISNSKLLPQLETADKLSEIIQMYL